MSINRAIRSDLAIYLREQLKGEFSDLTVSPRWPTAGKLKAPLELTVVAPGEPDTEYHAPSIHQVTPTVGVNAIATYSYGTVTLGLQIDAWANSPDALEELVEAVSAALNRPPADTLGLNSFPPELKRSNGLVLSLESLAGLLCDFRFEAEPDFAESSDEAQGGIFRATWTGEAFAHLVSQEQVTLLKQLTLGMEVNDATEDEFVFEP